MKIFNFILKIILIFSLTIGICVLFIVKPKIEFEYGSFHFYNINAIICFILNLGLIFFLHTKLSKKSKIINVMLVIIYLAITLFIPAYSKSTRLDDIEGHGIISTDGIRLENINFYGINLL